MVRRFLTTACAVIVAFPCVSLAAADLAAVVVTATRFSEADPGVAANISVITRQDIRNTPATNLFYNKLLNLGLLGVTLPNRSNFAFS